MCLAGGRVRSRPCPHAPSIQFHFLRQCVGLFLGQEERDREVGEKNRAAKTIEILEIEKRGLQDHLRGQPDGAHDMVRTNDTKTAVCAIC